MTLFPQGLSRPLSPGLERTVLEPHQVVQFEPSTSQPLSYRKRLHEFDVAPHIGMVVGGVKCDLGLVLVGATTKSEFQRIDE